MKLTKKTKIITATSLSVVMVAIIVTVILTGGIPSKVAENDDKKTSSDVVVNIPSDSLAETGSSTATENGKDNLVVDVGGNPTGTTGNSSNSAKPAEKSVTPTTQSQPNNNGDGIKIGNEAPPTDNSETNAFIKNLEIQGCPYCGSHTCESFYAKDEWGNPCYTPSKCSKYDITKDPVHYCQECHKKCGDGSNGTCVQFVNACYCPICGKWVPARTCHTCE
jgi:hypothetical protein